MDLEKEAKKLHLKIKECDSKIAEQKAELARTIKEKQDRLATDVSEDTTQANQKIFSLRQDIEDREAVKEKLCSELLSTAEKIKEERLSERKSKIASLKAEEEKHQEKIRTLSAEMQKHRAKISLSQVFLNGKIIQISPEENIAYQIMLAEGEMGEIKQLTEKDILSELGIELEEKKEEQAPPALHWQCGQCGLKRSFVTGDEQANFATRHFEGECETQKIAQKRAKREEVLS